MALRQKLEPLKLYALGAGSLVDAELAAYEAAFTELDKKLTAVLTQAFVQTATGNGLSLHERAGGIWPRTRLDVAKRRELLLYRLSVAPFDYNLAGMINSIRAAGMHADIVQNYAEEKLVIVGHGLIDSFTRLEDVKERVMTMLPAHLEGVLDMGSITWDMFELMVHNWTLWDSKNFTWEQFDVDMGNIFN